MYHLRDTINVVTWYQFGPHGTETFYLPSHPPRRTHDPAFAQQGYRYIAFNVRNYTDFIHRLKEKYVNVIEGTSETGPCARIVDPDGVSILLFPALEQTRRSYSPGAIVSIRESGVVAGDTAPYPDFFAAIGLELSDNANLDFIKPLFGYDGPVHSMLFGSFRIIHLPDEPIKPRGPSLFPFDQKTDPDPILDYYPNPGIKHLCYAVDDLAAFRKKAEAAGVYFLAPNLPLPGGSVMCYFCDPEGNVLEAFQTPPLVARLAAAAGSFRRVQLDFFSLIQRTLT